MVQFSVPNQPPSPGHASFKTSHVISIVTTLVFRPLTNHTWIASSNWYSISNLFSLQAVSITIIPEVLTMGWTLC